MKIVLKSINKLKTIQPEKSPISFVKVPYSRSCDYNHELTEKDKDFFYSQLRPLKGELLGSDERFEMETPNLNNNTVEKTVSNTSPNNESNEKKFKTKNNKFFAENKRFIFRADTLYNRESNEENKQPPLKENVKEKKISSKKSSTFLRTQNENVAKILKMINEDYNPSSFRYFSYGHLIIILMVLISFITAGTVVNQVFNSVSDYIDDNTEIERFKSNILKYIMLSQFYTNFRSTSDAVEIDSVSTILNSNLGNIINMEINGVNELDLLIYFPNYLQKINMSLIQGIGLIANYGRMGGLETEFILSNSLNIFEIFNNKTNSDELLYKVIDPIKTRIMYVCFVSIGVFAFLLLFQFYNIYSVFKYINLTLKLFISLSTNEYEKLYEDFQINLNLMGSQEITDKFEKAAMRKTLLFSNLDEGTSNHENKVAVFKRQETTDKNKKPKKTVRILVKGFKFPFLQYFILFFFLLLIFICFFIFLLYESQILDDSLYDSLSRNNYIVNMKTKNLEVFVRLIDNLQFSNSFGTSDDSINQLINQIDGFPQYLLSVEYDADPNYGDLLKQSLCESNIDIDLCKKIGEGVLLKGLNYAISFLLVKYKSIWLKIENLNDLDECIMIKTLNYAIENRIFEITELKNNSIIDQLKIKNLLMLAISLVSAFLLSMILIFVYTNYIGNALRKKVKNVRSMLKLIPVNSFLKSSKFKKYLGDTCHKTLMNI